MSKYNKTILTNAGLDLAARANSGKAKFTITRAATSTEKLADKSISELQKLTALPSLMQYGEINNVADSAQDKNIVIGTELVFNNKDLTTGYNVNTIGLFAKEEGTNKEILYALTTAVEPETMPDYKDKVLFKFNMTMFVVVGQTENVSVNVTDNGVATQVQLKEAINAAKKEIQEQVQDAIGDIHSIDNPDFHYGDKDTLDVDKAVEPGVHHLTKTKIVSTINPNALNCVPGGSTALTGYLIVNKHDPGNITHILLVYGSATPDLVIATRSISSVTDKRPDFQRLITSQDYKNIQNQIEETQQNTSKTWVGTLEEYQSMATHEPLTVYYIISDYEVVVK